MYKNDIFFQGLAYMRNVIKKKSIQTDQLVENLKSLYRESTNLALKYYPTFSSPLFDGAKYY